MNRLLIEAAELDAEGRTRVTGGRARHLLGVLKVDRGRRVRAGVIDGPTGEGVVEEVDTEAVWIRFQPDGAVSERPRIDLLLAAPRPRVMKRLWAQIAALGVDRVVIANARKVEAYYFASHAYTPEVWRPRFIEGLEQCGGTLLPRVHIARRFRRLMVDELDALSDADTRLVLHPGASELLVSAPHLTRARRLLLALGPEGGWTEPELDLLDEQGFCRVGLGMRILRTDTACIGALSIAAQRLEALG